MDEQRYNLAMKMLSIVERMMIIRPKTEEVLQVQIPPVDHANDEFENMLNGVIRDQIKAAPNDFMKEADDGLSGK